MNEEETELQSGKLGGSFYFPQAFQEKEKIIILSATPEKLLSRWAEENINV